MDAVYVNNINDRMDTTTLFTDNASIKFTSAMDIIQLIAIYIPLLMIKACYQTTRITLLIFYTFFKFLLYIAPKSIFSFTKNYIRDLFFVIVDSCTWPINLVLGIKPIYHTENTINKILTGSTYLPSSFYIQIIFSDILYPVAINLLLVLSVGILIGLMLFVFHKFLSIFYSEKLVININPFETTKVLFGNAVKDVKWVLELVHTTFKAFSELLKPLNSLRKIDEEMITAELKNVHQNYNPMTIKGTLNILGVVKSKVFSKDTKAEVQITKKEEKINTPPSTQGTDFSFDSMNGELTRRNIILRTDSIDKRSDKNTIQKISSIELAESLPKDFFQGKNNTKLSEDTTVLNSTK